MDRSSDIYELKADELDECLAFRNSIFSPIDHQHWADMKCTAVTARDRDGITGFIPLQFREQLVRPGLSVPVVYENAVGVAEKKRGTGVGSKMMDAAAECLQDRADALMVVRGGERSPGYRFYRRTGHSDLCYALEYSLAADAATPCGTGHAVTRVDRAGWLSAEGDLLRLHDRQYSKYAGGRPRRPGYWEMILDSHVYKSIGWKLLISTRNEVVTGYLSGIFGTWQHQEDMCVHEAVAVDENAMASLLTEAKNLSSSGVVRFPTLSLANPIRPVLDKLGFSSGETTPHLMARLLRPDRIFKRLAAGTDLEKTIAFTVVTPHRTVVVNEVSGAKHPKHHVLLELKEHDLARLFFCRMDLSAALDTETIRWKNRDLGLVRELGRVFRFADWVQWFTDYV